MTHMKRQGRGSIVNITSLAGLRGRPLRHSYIAAKHAIVGLTKSIALEGLSDNIRVNAVAPGRNTFSASSNTPGSFFLRGRLA